MRRVLVLLLVYACGGPTQSQLAETPSAQSRAKPSTAPPASTSDRDRERSIQQFEDMEVTQRAYRESEQPSGSTNPPPPPRQQAPGQQGPPGSQQPQKRKAPVEQAPKTP